MKILFDNNGFAYLSQQPEFTGCLVKLKELSRDSRVEIIGCCTLLQELSGLAHGLAQSKVQLYLATLSHYREVTQGRILRLSNDIVIEEGEQLKPLSFAESLLDETSVRNLFESLSDPSMAQELFGEVGSLKGKYG
ncbi:MAG: hypothetical protein AAB393_13565, partial [Bacteroidota bacterium]